jgi:hypothetical protein
MASQTLYRRDEVAKKNNSQGAWIVIHNSVYNVTEFLNEVSISCILFYMLVFFANCLQETIFLRSDLQDHISLVCIQSDVHKCSYTLL